MRTMLISDHYREQNALLHKKMSKFGSNGWKAGDKIRSLATKYAATSVLDYGSGKGTLKEYLAGKKSPLVVYQYDPGMNIDERQVCDIVLCRDVLEHIEPECLDEVIQDLHRLTAKVMYAVIATSKSGDALPDGRNAHLIIQPGHWWEKKLSTYFDFSKCSQDEKKKAIFEVTPR